MVVVITVLKVAYHWHMPCAPATKCVDFPLLTRVLGSAYFVASYGLLCVAVPCRYLRHERAALARRYARAEDARTLAALPMMKLQPANAHRGSNSDADDEDGGTLHSPMWKVAAIWAVGEGALSVATLWSDSLTLPYVSVGFAGAVFVVWLVVLCRECSNDRLTRRADAGYLVCTVLISAAVPRYFGEVSFASCREHALRSDVEDVTWMSPSTWHPYPPPQPQPLSHHHDDASSATLRRRARHGARRDDDKPRFCSGRSSSTRRSSS